MLYVPRSNQFWWLTAVCLASAYNLSMADGRSFSASWRDGRCSLPMADGGSFSECRACFRIGLHIGTRNKRIHCHRCRTASLERLYDQLLGIHGFTTDIKRIILWTIFRHPVASFKNEARELRARHMTQILRGPKRFSSHDGFSQRNNTLWIINEHMQGDRRYGVNFRGKRYNVGKGNLLTANHFFSLIIDFLF